jgi:putative ABC transport system substrate-binding protein
MAMQSTGPRVATVVAVLLLLASLVGEAQQVGKVPRVGVLAAGSPAEAPNTAFFDRMRELGYVEGRTVVFERRFAAGRIEDLPALAVQLVTTKPDVIFAPVTPAALAARKATQTIPIVFAVSADPVGAGLVTSLPQPGGNVTGLMSMNAELAAKRMELLKEVAPRTSRIAVFLNPDNVPDRQQLTALNRAATDLRVVIVPIAIRGPDDFTRAFTNTRAQGTDAIMIIPSPLNIQFRTRIFEFAVRSGLPTIDAEDRGAWEGALMSYGPSWVDNFRRAADLVDRILKGARPRDLPVEQPTKFELVINMKTAKTLGLSVPPSLMLRADQIIE